MLYADLIALVLARLFRELSILANDQVPVGKRLEKLMRNASSCMCEEW